MKSGGLNIPADKALDHVYGYAVGIDLTRRDLQIASRKKERPWEIGKSFDHSAPSSAIQPASKIGHPSKGRIWLTVNGTEQQKGDLTELIWSVPEIIWQLSQQVEIGAGDIITDGHPGRRFQLKPGDKIECGVDGSRHPGSRDRPAAGTCAESRGANSRSKHRAAGFPLPRCLSGNFSRTCSRFSATMLAEKPTISATPGSTSGPRTAKIDIKVLDLAIPIWRKAYLQPTANGPAGAKVLDAPKDCANCGSPTATPPVA